MGARGKKETTSMMEQMNIHGRRPYLSLLRTLFINNNNPNMGLVCYESNGIKISEDQVLKKGDLQGMFKRFSSNNFMKNTSIFCEILVKRGDGDDSFHIKIGKVSSDIKNKVMSLDGLQIQDVQEVQFKIDRVFKEVSSYLKNGGVSLSMKTGLHIECLTCLRTAVGRTQDVLCHDEVKGTLSGMSFGTRLSDLISFSESLKRLESKNNNLQ